MRIPLISVTAGALMFWSTAPADADVPVPIPRPALQTGAGEQGPAVDEPARRTREEQTIVDPEAAERTGQIVPVFDAEAAAECEIRLRRAGVRFVVEEDISGDPPCGLRRPLRIEAFGGGIEARGAPTLNCAMAEALDRWIGEVVEPSARLRYNVSLASVEFSTSYQCRRRNNSLSGKFSEHAFGNGVDITGFKLADGREISVREREPAEQATDSIAFQAAVRGGACAYFTTVLGPGTGGSHAMHFHFDLAIRSGGYRLCE